MIQKLIKWFKSLFKKQKPKKEKYIKINHGVGGRPDDRKGGG